MRPNGGKWYGKLNFYASVNESIQNGRAEADEFVGTDVPAGDRQGDVDHLWAYVQAEANGELS